MPNYFTQPMAQQYPNLEPGGFDALRMMLLQRQLMNMSNPYGLDRNYQGGFPGGNFGRGFNPYGGGRFGGAWGGYGNRRAFGGFGGRGGWPGGRFGGPNQYPGGLSGIDSGDMAGGGWQGLPGGGGQQGQGFGQGGWPGFGQFGGWGQDGGGLEQEGIPVGWSLGQQGWQYSGPTSGYLAGPPGWGQSNVGFGQDYNIFQNGPGSFGYTGPGWQNMGYMPWMNQGGGNPWGGTRGRNVGFRNPLGGPGESSASPPITGDQGPPEGGPPPPGGGVTPPPRPPPPRTVGGYAGTVRNRRQAPVPQTQIGITPAYAGAPRFGIPQPGARPRMASQPDFSQGRNLMRIMAALHSQPYGGF